MVGMSFLGWPPRRNHTSNPNNPQLYRCKYTAVVYMLITSSKMDVGYNHTSNKTLAVVRGGKIYKQPY